MELSTGWYLSRAWFIVETLTLQAWDNNGNNKAPTAGNNATVEAGDTTYVNWLGSKPYIARKSGSNLKPASILTNPC